MEADMSGGTELARVSEHLGKELGLGVEVPNGRQFLLASHQVKKGIMALISNEVREIEK